MNVFIQSLHTKLSQELSARIQRKLTFALSRMDSHISEISITLSEASVEGGNGKCCRLQLTAVDMDDIVIQDTQSDIYRAFDRALQRASRKIARHIDQQKKHHGFEKTTRKPL